VKNISGVICSDTERKSACARLTAGVRHEAMPLVFTIRAVCVDAHVRMCVQQRLACSAGDKPAGARVRSSVAWIAERRETEFLKPIDARLLGGRASYRAVMKMNVDVASKVRISEGRARIREGEGSMDSRNLTDAAVSLRRGGSDGTMTRTC